MSPRTVFFILISLVVCASADAQFSQQGNKLVGTGSGSSDPAQGWSVALSSDGNTAIVGGIFDNSTAGASWVFTRSAGTWTQQGNKLVGTGASADVAYQGYAVALSADGNTAIEGADDDNNEMGAVWVFTRSGGVWTQQGSKLVGTNGIEIVYQGTSVSLSADGNTALVGGPRDDNWTGAFWVFRRTGGVWAQQGNKLLCTGNTGSAHLGQAVSLSGDGNTALVGGPADASGAGAAWVFVQSGGVWTQQGSKLTGTGAVGAASKGVSAAISSDGTTAVVGGSDDNAGVGAAWIFVWNGSAWTQQGSKLVGSGAVGASNQGSSVSISQDGNTVLVGGEGDNGGAGAAWVFTRNSGAWTQSGSKIVGTGAKGAASQGKSVAVSPDGSTAIVGGDTDSSGTGAAWVFTHSALAVQLSHFSASVVNRTDVRLDWATLSETNNYGFQVQRAAPSGQGFGDLQNGFLSGHGTTLEEHRYSYTDASAAPGGWSYRLKQIDLDGSVTYAEPEQVEIPGNVGGEPLPVQFSLGQNFPNPFNPSTTITMALPRDADVRLDVYNTLGQKVAQLSDGVMTAGSHRIVFDGSRLASGVYIYRMKAGEFVQTRRLQLIR